MFHNQKCILYLISIKSLQYFLLIIITIVNQLLYVFIKRLNLIRHYTWRQWMKICSQFTFFLGFSTCSIRKRCKHLHGSSKIFIGILLENGIRIHVEWMQLNANGKRNWHFFEIYIGKRAKALLKLGPL